MEHIKKIDYKLYWNNISGSVKYVGHIFLDASIMTLECNAYVSTLIVQDMKDGRIAQLCNKRKQKNNL
jgi:hypothetical protein